MGSGTNFPGRGPRQAFMPVLAGTFVVAGCALLPFYRYELNPDGISYVSIASQYVAGYGREAINAYWGPLYSWCIAVLLWLRIPALIGVKTLGILLGVATLFGLRRLARIFAMRERIQWAFLWVASAMVLGFAMEWTTPDLLFAALLLFYFSLIFDPAYPSSRYGGLVCGIIGGLAYLTKSYGLIFFMMHFAFMGAFHFWRTGEAGKRIRVARHFAAGFVVCCAIAFPWIAILHAKYGVWMTGTTGDFNLRLVGPQSEGYPHFRHLIPISSEHAITAWQDPSPSWLPRWNVLASRSNLAHESRVVYGNAKLTVWFWYHTSLLFFLIVPAYVILSIRYSSPEWIYVLFTIALLCGGYLLITVENRYFWAAELLLVWMAFRTLELFAKNFRVPGAVIAVGGCLLAASFLRQPVSTLRAHFLADKKLYDESEQLLRTGDIKGRLASCANWPDSAYLAFRLGDPYYGVPAPAPEADRDARELNPDYRPKPSDMSERTQIFRRLSEERIDYFILWPDCPPLPSGAGEREIRAGDLAVVRLRPNIGH